MKIIRTIFLATVLLLVDFSYAGPSDMPHPTAKGASTAGVDDDGTPTPTPSPIDQDLFFLMIAGLALGTVFIYRNKIKKASV
ncbi:hypothetical protein [Flavobacterium sp. ov086]|uniref:hypothetical protein n=1 Tax=Flavobacterium sp. ov086 TaxID=1761785 RepID=UPI000B691876|nr:hypothetical protein [Flavobacterium sp. ov086]SNR53063.1 hypothetical protein SAMN04487979_11021 [Flavobacterium sp. ov086]